MGLQPKSCLPQACFNDRPQQEVYIAFTCKWFVLQMFSFNIDCGVFHEGFSELLLCSAVRLSFSSMQHK